MNFEIEGSFKIEKSSKNTFNFLFRFFYLNVFSKIIKFFEEKNLYHIDDEGLYNEKINQWKDEHFYDLDYDEALEIFKSKYKWYNLENNFHIEQLFVFGYMKLIKDGDIFKTEKINSVNTIRDIITPLFGFDDIKNKYLKSNIKIEYYISIN